MANDKPTTLAVEPRKVASIPPPSPPRPIVNDESDTVGGYQPPRQTFGNEGQSAKTKEAAAQEKAQRAKLQADGEVWLEVLAQERENFKDIRTYVMSLPKNLSGQAKYEAIMDEFRARELYLNLVKALESQIKLKLGITPNATK